MSFWHNKAVFLTGHTGFKGCWLTLWLHQLGARVFGYSLPPNSQPSLFEAADLRSLCAASTLADLSELACLKSALQASQAEIVIHMAAQALVLPSYQNPLETWQTNVMGTVHLLEAARTCPSVRSLLVVTSDKCYHPPVPVGGYTETHALGGHDPYSASKGAAEIVAQSYRSSFAECAGLACGRAGNVIGGGDWAAHRLVPDLVRALRAGGQLELRSPTATRPWQHVLEPLSGYLQLLEALWHHPEEFAEGWNFGPELGEVRSVAEVVDSFQRAWGSDFTPHYLPSSFEEAPELQLNIEKARTRLGWTPRLDFARSIQWTADWYRRFYEGASPRALMEEQLAEFGAVAKGEGSSPIR